MTDVALFHSVLGVRRGTEEAAERLRSAGHDVLVVDQYEGRTFDDYDEADAYVESVGFPKLMRRAAEAVEALADAGYRVLVTGGPEERELTARVAGARGIDLGGATSLPEMAALLDGAAAVVVGNTGPAHLAAAVGTPVVSLFSPVVPAARWAPYGVPTVLLGDQSAPCRGTRARECPVPGHPCLTSVTAQDVVAAVAQLRTVQQPAGLRTDAARGAATKYQVSA